MGVFWGNMCEELPQVNFDNQGDPRWDDLRYLIADFKNVISIVLPNETINLLISMARIPHENMVFLKL